jgi:hypothetical protein
MKLNNHFVKQSYLYATAFLFLLSISLHWFFGWKAYVNESKEHNQQPQRSEYLIEMTRDTMENWQSEFLQLIWQVAGLAILYCVGSPSSKEGDERKEEKIDFIIKRLEPEKYKEILKNFEEKYPKK